MKPTLSLAMIVRDESATLRRILSAAAQFCDEMIVVDTGSLDDTVSIALECGAQVHHFTWIDDFAAARNYSFSKCTSDWILWLDADDVLPESTIEIGKRIVTDYLSISPADYIFAPYHYAFGPDGKPSVAQARERFVRRSANPVWVGTVHETMVANDTKFINCPEFIIEHRPLQEHLESGKTSRNMRLLHKQLELTPDNTRAMYQLGAEYRATGQHEEAAKGYERYIELWDKNFHDLFEEPYVVHIDLCACYRELDRPRDVIRVALDAIRLNASRAEAYAQVAIVHYALGNFTSAFPMFLAAAACKQPAHGGVVYDAFYSASIHEMILDCKAKIKEQEDAHAAAAIRVPDSSLDPASAST